MSASRLREFSFEFLPDEGSCPVGIRRSRQVQRLMRGPPPIVDTCESRCTGSARGMGVHNYGRRRGPLAPDSPRSIQLRSKQKTALLEDDKMREGNHNTCGIFLAMPAKAHELYMWLRPRKDGRSLLLIIITYINYIHTKPLQLSPAERGITRNGTPNIKTSRT